MQEHQTDRRDVPVAGGATDVLVDMNLESVVCVPSLVTFSADQLKRRRELGCLCLRFM